MRILDERREALVERERELLERLRSLPPGSGRRPTAPGIRCRLGRRKLSALSDPDLDETLAGRLDLPHSAGEEALLQALSHVEERSGGDQETFTGAPDMSHETRTEEREG